MEYTIAEGMIVETVGDETVITHPNGNITVLNKTAGLILKTLANGKCGAQTVARALESSFSIDQNLAITDTRKAFGELQRLGVIRAARPPKLRKRTVTRRTFAAGIAAMSLGLVKPVTAFGSDIANASNLADGVSFNSANNARALTDSLGRQVEIPPSVSRVAPYGPYAQAILETLAPDMIVQVTARGVHASALFAADGIEQTLLASAEEEGKQINEYVASSVSPDLVIDIATSDSLLDTTIDSIQNDIGIPVAHITVSPDDLANAFRSLGAIVGREERGNALGDYADSLFTMFAQGREAIDQSSRKRVYYGEGADGLNTRASGTLLDSVIAMVGGMNIMADLPQSQCVGLSFNDIELRDPHVILLSQDDSDFPSDLPSTLEKKWKGASISYMRKVRLVPANPRSWLDRSPLIMQTLGALWLANLLYPEIFDYDMIQTVIDFYALLYDEELSEDEVAQLLEETILS